MTDTDVFIWHDPSERPSPGTPVIAEFNEWDEQTNPTKEQVVWWHEGAWRSYPRVDDRAYVNRWREIPGAFTKPSTGSAADVEAIASMLASIRQGRSGTARCEPPGQYAIGRARADVKDVFEALAALSISAPTLDSK